MTSYNPDTDIPSLADKVILITGGTKGIGKTTLLELAKHNPAEIYFTGRDEASATSVITEAQPLSPSTKITFLPCDMTSLSSVHAAADKFTALRLDIFIANAGIMAGPPGLTQDGYEVQFGVNHLGNTTLLLRLLPIMEQTANLPGADVRYVSLTSLGYKMHPAAGVALDTIRTTQESFIMGAYGRYGQSKLANILTTREVAKRYKGKITAIAVHPGVVKTELVTKLGFVQKAMVYLTNPRGLISPREGCFNTLWAATSDELQHVLADGKTVLVEPVGKPSSGVARCWDDELAAKLWSWTEQVVQESRK